MLSYAQIEEVSNHFNFFVIVPKIAKKIITTAQIYMFHPFPSWSMSTWGGCGHVNEKFDQSDDPTFEDNETSDIHIKLVGSCVL